MQPSEVLLFFHLPGDIDALGPVLERALSQWQPLKVRTGTTKPFLARDGVRRFFSDLGETPMIIPDSSAQSLTPLDGLKAIVTGSETTLKPHRTANELTLALKGRGLRAYTVQHGFENVGLSYFDAIQGTDVRFAADRIFTWGPSSCLPPEIPDENRAKTVAVGRPAFRRRPYEPAWPDASQSIDVAIFENLHWHRFDDVYRHIVLDEIQRICAAHPSWRFLIKPHPQGRWLTQRFKGEKPAADNLVMADPALPEWSGVSGHAVICRAGRILTTPSTIALDAAQANKPVAIFSYGLPLPLYDPLTLLESGNDLDTFLMHGDAKAGRDFVERAIVPGDAAQAILDAIARDIQAGA